MKTRADFPKLPVRCYDNGGATMDRYTVVYTAPYCVIEGMVIYLGIGMSDNPTHPQGFGQHFELKQPFLRMTDSKEIQFNELPKACRLLVAQDLATWDE